ncbi:hypothetical protein PUN28_011978 [Cardiocondyla obscurior]|uniref:Uncharacterized protein n=1 Tax=Cardiocondyla obscurior TaxID=286306 RepID=A0AAW2FDL5_9HYME
MSKKYDICIKKDIISNLGLIIFIAAVTFILYFVTLVNCLFSEKCCKKKNFFLLHAKI